MKSYFSKTLALLSIFGMHITLAIDNPHFYRATNFFGETRFERTGLTTLDMSFAGGHTHTGFDCGSNKVPLLDIWGTQNMRALGVGVPCKDPNNCLDLILIELSKQDPNCGFANFSICSKFKIFEANFSFYQNFACGFFFHAHMPVRHMELNDICFQDISPVNEECFGCPNIDTPIWQTFLENFDQILDRWGLCCGPFNEWGIGDTSFLLGWTHNYQETDLLDFVDMTIEFGALAPTAKRKHENQIFSLPFGYNGHWAIQGIGKMAFGLYDWLTFGGHIEAMYFLKHDHNIRMNTAPCQSSLIRLARGDAEIKPGVIWDASVYAKADHFVGGLSFLAAYQFASKNEDSVMPCQTDIFSPNIVNGDAQFQSWKMHTLHLMAEYDFYKPYNWVGPRIGFFWNYVMSGKRIFRTNMLGGSFGIDFTHNF